MTGGYISGIFLTRLVYFEKEYSNLTVKYIRCEKKSNTKDIVFSLDEASIEEEDMQLVKWEDFSSHLLSKIDKYINYICANNLDSHKFIELINLYEITLGIQSC